MDIRKVRAKGELVLLFFIVIVGIISLLVVFYPIFKASIINPFTDALFIFLIFLICWFTFVTFKTMKDNPPPENKSKDKGEIK